MDAKKKQQKRVRDRSEKNDHHKNSEAVNRTDRHIQKAAVLIFAGFQRHIADLNAPADKRPENKHMKHLIQTVFKKRYSFHRIPPKLVSAID